MSKRAWIAVAIVCIAALAIGAFAVASWTEAPESSEGAGDDEVERRAPDWERWSLLDGEEPPPEQNAAEGAGRPSFDRGANWEERRARWREAWRQSVDIAPLGPSDPGFGPDDLRDALAPGREALRACIEENGGWRALRGAPRAEGERQRRPRRSVSFDVRPDGTVDAETVAIAPPMPDEFDACFRTYFGSARLPSVGGDGARVELPLGPGGRRRGRWDGDGGVPMRWRDRPREERRRDRGEDRE
jgi:hypothetical protein